MNNQHEIFRLAAILYADNNYEVSTTTIHKKIIESALLEKEPHSMSLTQVILFVHANYGLLLSEKDVQKVLYPSKNTDIDAHFSNGDTMISLSPKRVISLKSKVSNSIGDYITEFENIFSVIARDIINRYLYELFQTNITGFQHLFKPAEQSGNSIKVDSQGFSEDEKEIINSFLNWDNPSKNKAIFDLASLSLEYCVLTNKSNNLNFVNLRNKQFYLDTNVLYRVLGINGKDRQELTKTFLSKFNQVGEKLLISIATELEFKDSIKFHVDNIRKHNNPKVSSQLFAEVLLNDDIYNYYHRWKAHKVNANTDLFLAHIYSNYEAIKNELSIVVDRTYPYDRDTLEISDKLRQLSSEIYNYKVDGTGLNSATVDAENIFWIETKRDAKNTNINETVFFFLSTDQILRKWDYQRATTVPIVMLPSQWLSILLRFVERSNDDYKSFVSFLNLRSNEALIDGEKLQIVLEGISEITTDISTQRQLLNTLINNRFNDVIEGVRTDNDIFEKSKQFAKTETDRLLEEFKIRTETLDAKLDSLSEELASQEENKTSLTDKDTQLSDIIKRYNKLIAEKRKKYVDKHFCCWRIPAYLLLIVSVAIVVLLTLTLCGTKNILLTIFRYTDINESDTLKNICWILYGAAILGLFGTTWRITYKRFNKKDAGIKRDALERNFTEINLE